jgi:DNA mismatch repair protein MutL
MLATEPTGVVRRPIRLLAPEIANRIAAGEVVERPASVIKELCENALDAQARMIEVDVEGGGTRLLRVRDDGFGIPPDEAPLALERHATSKIHDAHDLDAIATLGFRGEALPSIAAVSRFVLQSRARGYEVGTRVEVEGGGPATVREAGCPEGTLLEVRDLFFNVPARRKFLRSAQTEVGHAVEAVSRLALAFPFVDLRVRVDGREALHAPPARGADAVIARAAQVLTREVVQHLYPCDGGEGRIHVRGLVGDPSHARGRADSIYTYVNGRFTRDRVLQHAVQAAYLPVLERGRYPWVVLFVELPPETVDVNVHPAKTEVRFADSRPVHHAVEHVVAQAIARAPWVGGARTYLVPTKAEPASDAARAASPGTVAAPGSPPGQAPLSFSGADGRTQQHLARLREVRGAYHTPPPDRDVLSPSRRDDEGAARMAPPTDDAPHGGFAALRVVGQVHRLYLVCEGADEVVLIDQHAAHERVQFERLRAAFHAGRVTSQALLFPATLELSPLEREAAEAYGDELARLGFEIEPFGAGTVALKAAPASLKSADAARVAQDLLSELSRVGRASALEARIDSMLATVACHSSVRAGDALTNAEAAALLADLDRVDFRGNCPHGRPVVLRARVSDLERGFARR